MEISWYTMSCTRVRMGHLARQDPWVTPQWHVTLVRKVGTYPRGKCVTAQAPRRFRYQNRSETFPIWFFKQVEDMELWFKKTQKWVRSFFSWRSNRSNITCREIFNGCRNTKGNPLCFGNYEQLLDDLGEFGPKNPRPPKFEWFDRREKMIEIDSSLFKPYLHVFNFPKK